jgi:hypothetical protein
MTKVNKWTLGLAAVGLVSIPAVVQAEEKPNQLLTALSSTTISGYVNTSAHWVPGTGNANPPAYAFNLPSKQDGFNLNVVNIVLEKPLDEGTWSAGYKADLIFGPDAVGWNSSANTLSGIDNEVAIKQAYVALRAPVGNGIDLKLGTWDTIIGYEVFNSGSNPNYTRSWGYTMEPTQHTGLLGSYQVSKCFGFSAGIANTWSSGINVRSGRTESDKSYMGAVTLTAPDSWGFAAGSTLAAGIVDGFNGLVGNDVTSYYIGGTLATPIKQLKVGGSYDYVHVHDNSLNGPTGDAMAAAIYASVQATEKLSFHLRGEWADITDAWSTGGKFNGAGGVGGVPAEVISLTGTIQYDLWANVISRLEVRWDRAIDGDGPFGGYSTGARGSAPIAVGSGNTKGISPGTGFNPGGANEKNAVLVAANIIYKF